MNTTCIGQRKWIADEGDDGKQHVFENGRFVSDDVTQHTQEQFFLNDTTQDTDAHNKYSL